MAWDFALSCFGKVEQMGSGRFVESPMEHFFWPAFVRMQWGLVLFSSFRDSEGWICPAGACPVTSSSIQSRIQCSILAHWYAIIHLLSYFAASFINETLRHLNWLFGSWIEIALLSLQHEERSRVYLFLSSRCLFCLHWTALWWNCLWVALHLFTGLLN